MAKPPTVTPKWTLRPGKDPDTDPQYPGHGYTVIRDGDMIFERDVAVTLRDGTTIFNDVFRPEADGEYPVVLGYAPFGKHPHIDWEAAFPGSEIPPGNSKYTAFEAVDPVVWTKAGYFVVNADPRGVRYSEGIAQFMTQQEGEDEYDLIEWLAVQPWSNGNIGTNGVSYFAMSAYQVAALQPPHLKAVILFEALNDFYRDVKFHGGIPNFGLCHGWMQMTSWSKTAVEDMEAGMREHPLYDEFWTSRVADLSKFEVPVWVVSSWANHGIHTRGPMQAWEEISSTEKWLDLNGRKEWMNFYLPESVAKQMAFFDKFLKGEEDALAHWPEVLCEVRDHGNVSHFRTDTQYPLSGTEFRTMYLDAVSNSLSFDKPSVEASVDYPAKTGNATFRYTFTEPTELIGPAALNLWFCAQGAEDADLFVGLRKFTASGEEVHFPYLGLFDHGIVALGWQRLSLRALDAKKSRPEKPYPLFTKEEHLYNDEIVEVNIPILDSGTRFEAGETLVVDVRGSDQIIGAGMIPQHPENRNRGTHVIHTGGEYPSNVILPFAPIAPAT